MAFKLGDIIVKDILYAMASNITTGDPLYILTQLSEASINITSDSNDITDKDGNIVLRNYRSKSGEFQSTNAFINVNVLAAAGASTDFAAVDNALISPKIIKVKKSAGTAVLENVVAGTITVNQYFGDGALGKSYENGLVASETEFAVTTGSTTIYNFPDVSSVYVVEATQSEFPVEGDATKKYIDKATGKVYNWDSAADTPAYVEDTSIVAQIVSALPETGETNMLYVVDGETPTVHTCTITTTPTGTSTVTLPTDEEADYFVIKYKRTFTDGAIIRNSAKEFPTSVNMLMKVLYFDPCAKDEIKAAYIEMPSFKVSPETTVPLNPESPTMDFNGTLELDYCSDDKELYRIYLVNEIDAA